MDNIGGDLLSENPSIKGKNVEVEVVKPLRDKNVGELDAIIKLDNAIMDDSNASKKEKKC